MNYFIENLETLNLVKHFYQSTYETHDFFFARKRAIYYPVLTDFTWLLFTALPYNLYRKQFWHLRSRFLTLKYFKILRNTVSVELTFRKYHSPKHRKNLNVRLLSVFRTIRTYLGFLNNARTDLFYFFKQKILQSRPFSHYLTLSFCKNKLYINLQGLTRKTYAILTAGFFIRFYERKKSLRKSKAVRVLMARYLRKLLLVIQVRALTLVVKKNPKFFLEFMNILYTPLTHQLTDPLTGLTFDDVRGLVFKIPYFIFYSNKSYSFNKGASVGRIKRKVLRRLVYMNKVID
jgi:hypothetical protein